MLLDIKGIMKVKFKTEENIMKGCVLTLTPVETILVQRGLYHLAYHNLNDLDSKKAWDMLQDLNEAFKELGRYIQVLS